jgi:hypothetical protein
MKRRGYEESAPPAFAAKTLVAFEAFSRVLRVCVPGGAAGPRFDLSLTGFSDDELAGLLSVGTAGLTDPDAIPPLPEHPVTRAGDLWCLGPHRLLCGDSTKADDVACVRLLRPEPDGALGSWGSLVGEN